jgi:hypothetical protein
MKLNVPYILDRLKELSTWRMLGAAAGAFGIAITTGQVQVLFGAFTAGVALWEAFQPEAPKA